MGRPYKHEVAFVPDAIAWAAAQDVTLLRRAILDASAKGLVAIGSGGSFTAATFAARCHERRFGQLSRAVTPLEYKRFGATLLNVATMLLSAEEEDEEGDDYEEGAQTESNGSGIKRVKPDVVLGAAIQLTHRYGRPLYYSFDRLADASSDNIEQFINLAGALVDEVETRILRGKSSKNAQLDARQQHLILTTKAEQVMKQWDFPHCEAVRMLVKFIASRCVARTLEANAPLSDGANAFGIPQAEMDSIETSSPGLVPVLHYALAYNAISLRENYPCKKRFWCLFELGGIPIVANKLTLGRGGFCEGHISDVRESISR